MKKQILTISLLLFALVTYGQAPSLLWAKGMGGSGYDLPYSTAVDGQGNVYTIGEFRGTSDFDPNAGVYNLTSANPGVSEVFISKLDALGNFVWAKKMGEGGSVGHSIVIDSANNVYTTGMFYGTGDFDPNAGVYNLSSVAGTFDIFISKLDASGNFVWAKHIGGNLTERNPNLTLDVLSNVYISGTYRGTVDFDPNAGIYNLPSIGGNAGEDLFILKLDASGNFIWVKQIGPVGNQKTSIAVDLSGFLYVAGRFQTGIGTVDFDPNAGIYNLTSTGNCHTFICKLDTSGNFVWAKNMGGLSGNLTFTYYIGINALGNVYTTGQFNGTIDFDPNAGVFNLTSAGPGSGDIFISKLDVLGNLVWVKNMGGNATDVANSLALDSIGNVYTTGQFIGTVDFDPNAGTFNLTSDTGAFISKLDPSGNLIWAKSFDGAIGRSIAIDIAGNIHAAGVFTDTVDFDPNAGILNLTSSGAEEIFVLKLSPYGVSVPENTNANKNAIYPNPSNGLYTLALEEKAEIVITNMFGEIILNQQMQAGKQLLYLQEQANGIYFVKVISEGKIAVTKLLKQ